MKMKAVVFISIVKVVILTLQVRDFVAEQMSVRGIEFHTEESPQAIIKGADGSLSLKTNKGTVEGFSHVMFATGRRANTKVFEFLSCTWILWNRHLQVHEAAC